MKNSLTSVKTLILVMIVGLLVGGTALVFAQGNGIIHSCVDKKGILRIVSSPDECKTPKEEPLSWDQSASGGGGGGVLTAQGAACEDNPKCASFTTGAGSCGNVDYKTSVPINGKFVSLSVFLYENNLVDNFADVTLIVNNADSALKIQIPAGSTTMQTVFADVDVQAGDLVWIEGDGTSASNGCMFFNASTAFQFE